MKKTRLCSLFFATALAIGCEEPTSSDSVINATGGSRTGGKAAMGGATSTGGNTATGGSVMTGSVDAKVDTMTMASGGVINTGAGDATGGVHATGGAKATGGDMATGGAKATGGTSATGGTTATGGAKATGGTTATGGAKATGGTTATGGAKATGGTTTTSGSSSSSSGSSSVSCSTSLPSAKSKKTISSPQSVSGTFDGEMVQYCGSGSLGGSGQNEGQAALFNVANGGTLKNVIVGGSGCPAADGVHCAGSCTLENVWWGDVGEDAATFRGGSTKVVIKGGGAFSASDKVFQDNTTGGSSVTITNFFVSSAGKLYRSCGTCAKADRHVIMQNIAYQNVKQVAGLNSNNGDTAKMSGLTDCGGGAIVCADYTWVAKGTDPPRNGECKY